MENEPTKNAALVETATVKKIRRVLDATARRAQFTFIFGPTGRGKTFTARDWLTRHAGGYIRVQTGDTACRLRRQVSYLLFGHEHAGNREIIETLHARSGYVLIVDEAALLLHDGAWAARSKNINFFRDLFDGVNDNGGAFGVVFIFTDCNISMFEGGSRAAFFGQFLGRMDNHLSLSDRISVPFEIKRALAFFGFDAENNALLTAAASIANGPGKMRSLYKYLAIAREYHAEKGVEITGKTLAEIQYLYAKGDALKDE